MEQQDQRVVVETSMHRITGTISLPRDGYRSRLTDYLNAAERSFMALTDVELEPLDGGRPLARYPFLALSISQIVFARPADAQD